MTSEKWIIRKLKDLKNLKCHWFANNCIFSGEKMSHESVH